jgi:hypothetical protein
MGGRVGGVALEPLEKEGERPELWATKGGGTSRGWLVLFERFPRKPRNFEAPPLCPLPPLGEEEGIGGEGTER